MEFSSLPSDEKPREKLFTHGPSSLSLAELVAVLLRTGRQGEDVVEMSRNLIARMGGLEGLTRAATEELLQEKGLKQAKVASLVAALELGKRIALLKSEKRGDWKQPLLAKALEVKHMERECIYAFFLDVKDRVIGEDVISYGGLSGAFLDMPYLFRQAVRLSAAKIALMHNHPDGCASPSREDLSLTEHVERGLRCLGMELKGHYRAAGGELYTVKGEEVSPDAADSATN